MFQTVFLRALEADILSGPHAAECAPHVRLNDSPRESYYEDVPTYDDQGQPMRDAQGAIIVKRIERRVNPAVYDKAIADILNEAGDRKKFIPMQLTSLGLATRFPSRVMPDQSVLPGPLHSEMVLQKIEAFLDATVQSPDIMVKLFGAQIKRQMVHLTGTVGLDFGNSDMHDMFDRMLQAGALDAEDVKALKSVAEVADSVTPDQVSRALRGPWGDE